MPNVNRCVCQGNSCPIEAAVKCCDLPEVGVFHLVDDGVVLPNDTVGKGVVFKLMPHCIEVSTVKADVFDARNGIFRPKKRVVFPNAGIRKVFAREVDCTACINVARRCVNGQTVNVALIVFVDVGIKELAVLPYVIAASHYPIVAIEGDVVEIGVGVGCEYARVVHPNATAII